MLGRTHYTVGLIEGGVAPNVVPARASAEVLFRSVGPHDDLRAALAAAVADRAEVEEVLEVPPVRLDTREGFESAVFAYTTDIPLLSNWGTPSAARPRLHPRRAHRPGARPGRRAPWRPSTCYDRLASSLLAEVGLGLGSGRDLGSWVVRSWGKSRTQNPNLRTPNLRTPEPQNPRTPRVLHWYVRSTTGPADRTRRPDHSPVAGRTAARDLCNLRAANRVRAGRQQR